jgi:hypothetical protein
MKVLVCGGRDFDNIDAVAIALKDFKPESILAPSEHRIIHGGASGADQLADRWASVYGVPVRVYPAHWERDGRAAGPIRNQRMLDEGKPDLVIAFPGGRGTADMVRRAKKAGVEVREIRCAKERRET